MYCRNCGNELIPQANVCTQCGVLVGNGDQYCPNCAAHTDPKAVVCVKCGASLHPWQPAYNGAVPQQKSKIVAGLLGILLGGLGIHNFYLGYTQKAILQLVLTLAGGMLTCGISSTVVYVWGLVEGVLILIGNIDKDADGNPLGQ